jgi:hypothetical protein
MTMINNPYVKAAGIGAGIFLLGTVLVSVAYAIGGSAGAVIAVGLIVAAGIGTFVRALMDV